MLTRLATSDSLQAMTISHIATAGGKLAVQVSGEGPLVICSPAAGDTRDAKPWGPALWRMFAARLWPGLGDGARERANSTTALLTRPGRWPAFHATITTDHRVVAPWIQRVTVPVFVVMGDADPDWKNPAAEAQWVASNFSDAEVVGVAGAGHAPMLERPDFVGPAVAGFLDKVGRSGTFQRSVA